MEKRLLLDGVDIHRNEFPIDERVQCTVPVLADGADSSLPILYDAMVGTEKAPYFVVIKLFVKARFLHPEYIVPDIRRFCKTLLKKTGR